MTTLINNIVAEKKLYFLKSSCIQAYPCGRRRTQGISGNSVPIDPESKLITEANTCHTVALNGFTQNFILPIDSSSFILAIAGYYFKIAFPLENTSERDILTIIGEQVGASTNTVYANVIRVDTPLYEELGKEPINTKVLGSLHSNLTGTSEISLDIQYGASDVEPSDFYFSGLAFSTEPLNDPVESVCVLVKTSSGVWNFCKNSELPEISHGNSENSVVLGGVELANGSGTFSGHLNAKYFDQYFGESTAGGQPITYPIPSLFLTENGDSFRLNFKYNI